MRRKGFTVLEVVAAVGILFLAMMLVTQAGLWGLTERQRAAQRQEATELAINVLEAARATPLEGLTSEWAASQRLPEYLARRLPGGEVVVRVEPEGTRKHLKRATVTVQWTGVDGRPARPVHLAGWFAARTRPTEDKP